MPNINPKGPGDVVYPQYAVVTTEPVSAIKIVKGRLYTKGANAAATANQLVAIGSGGSVLNGVYQAMADIETAGTAGENKVQCLGPGSIILCKTGTPNMHPGQLLKWDTSENEVEPAATSDTAPGLVIGRVFKIYTKTELTSEKGSAADGDYVYVRLLG